MQKKCDLYFYDEVKSDKLRFVGLLDKDFVFDDEKSYFGFLQLNIDRVKLVPVVTELRRTKVTCFSVPIEYRDFPNIPVDVAFNIAAENAKALDATVAFSARLEKSAPVFWIFDLIFNQHVEEKIGGVMMIDRLDGHVWTLPEYEEYFYDYNNIF